MCCKWTQQLTAGRHLARAGSGRQATMLAARGKTAKGRWHLATALHKELASTISAFRLNPTSAAAAPETTASPIVAANCTRRAGKTDHSRRSELYLEL